MYSVPYQTELCKQDIALDGDDGWTLDKWYAGDLFIRIQGKEDPHSRTVGALS